MDTREACFHCGEPALLEARVCPHCRRGLLYDVALDAPLGDERRRYHVARALAALPGWPGFTELQRELGTARARLARGVTRAQAARLCEAAQAQGLATSMTPTPASGVSAGVVLALAAVASCLALAALAALGWWWTTRTRTSRTTAPAAPSVTPAATAEPTLTPREIAARVLPSVTSLRCPDSVGAGFFVGPEELLTNAHVLCPEGVAVSVVFHDGRTLPGGVVRRDVALDLALVRVPGAQAAGLALGDAGALALGDRVLAAGSPVGLEFSVSEGLVSSLERVLYGVAYVQTDAKINPGNSGGPLLDARGRVVAIVSLKHAQAEGIAFALPINYAYAGAQPFLAAPDAQPPSPGWEAMLARAEQQNRDLRGEISSLALRPALVGVRLDEYQRLVARVLRPARNDPGYTDVKFKLWSGDAVVCTLGGAVAEWKVVERAQSADPNERRMWNWLEANGLDARLFVGEAAMSWNFCPHDRLRAQGATLELEDADPQAAKLQLRYW